MNVKDKKRRMMGELRRDAVIAIIRGVAADRLSPLVAALCAGGIRWAEITFDQSRPESDGKTAGLIAGLKREFAGRMRIGAGTVMTQRQAELAIEAGAEFLISPNIDEKIIRYTASTAALSIPGAMTPTEIAAAYAAGADAVKVFPVDVLGPAYLKAVASPMPHIPLIAVGGISEKNVREYLNTGIAGVGVGSSLTPKELIAKGDFESLTALAGKFAEAAGR